MSAENQMVEVDAEKRMERGGSTALYQGKDDPQNGREIWVWVPTSRIKDNGDGTFSMPEWLALDKGLI